MSRPAVLLRKFAIVTVVFTGAALLVSEASGEATLEAWARELSELRSEISLLETRLRAERERGLARLRSLEGRRGEASARLDAVRSREASARRKLDDARERVAAREEKRTVYRPVVEEHLAKTRAAVEGSLPFRREERLAALDELATKLDSGALAPEKAATQLWRFIEDELRLTREVSLTKIPLRIEEDGPRHLTEVVRFGMVTLYTRCVDCGDLHFGQMVKGDDGRWRHEVLEDEASQQQVKALFESLEKNITEGAYELPLPPLTTSSSDGSREPSASRSNDGAHDLDRLLGTNRSRS